MPALRWHRWTCIYSHKKENVYLVRRENVIRIGATYRQLCNQNVEIMLWLHDVYQNIVLPEDNVGVRSKVADL